MHTMQISVKPNQSAIRPSRAKLKVVSSRQHPLDALRDDLKEQIDMHDLFTCSRETFDEIMDVASTKLAQAWLQGIYDSRVMLAAVTGQRF